MATVLIPLGLLDDSPFQTRTHYDTAKVEALAESIRQSRGLLSPPVARLVGADGAPAPLDQHGRAIIPGKPESGHVAGHVPLAFVTGSDLRVAGWRVQLAVGHTRLRAYRLLDERERAAAAGGLEQPAGTWASMPVDLRALDDDAMERASWDENAHRADLDPVDRAQAIAARVARHGWTHAQAAEQLGLERSTVSNILRWYRALSDAGDDGALALDNLRAGLISEGAARALAGVAIAAAEHPAAYAEIDEAHSLGLLVCAAAEPDVTADDVRRLCDVAVRAIEAEAERQRREREPSMFDGHPDDDEREAIAPGDERYYEPPPAPPADVPAENIAGSTDARESNPAPVVSTEATRPAERAKPRAVSTDTPDGEHVAAEWAAVEGAVVAVLRTIPTPARALLSRLLIDRQRFAPLDPESFAWPLLARHTILGEMRDQPLDRAGQTEPTAREAAEAWGLAVEWPAVPPAVAEDVAQDADDTIEPSPGAALEVEAGGIPPEAVEISRSAVIEEIGAHIEAAREARRLARHKSPDGKRRKELEAEASNHEDLANAKLEQFGAVASDTDVRAVCDALGIDGPADVSAETSAEAEAEDVVEMVIEIVDDERPGDAADPVAEVPAVDNPVTALPEAQNYSEPGLAVDNPADDFDDGGTALARVVGTVGAEMGVTSAETTDADERPGDAADPVAATRAALARGDDPALVRRDLDAAVRRTTLALGAADDDDRHEINALADRLDALTEAVDLTREPAPEVVA